MKIGRRQLAWTYAVAALLLVTGLGWWWLDRFGRVAGEFGEEAHPWAPTVLMLHGLAAGVFLVILGSLIPHHALRAYRARANRISGLSVVALNAALAGSGYALYYAGGETFRAWAARCHLWLGVALPLLLLAHVLAGRRWRRGWLSRRGKPPA